MSTACPILLWDHLAVAAPGQGPPVIATLEACDSIPAFCTFLDGLTPGPRSIRLFYQGPSLEAMPTSCPRNSSRRLLRQVLGAKFPALAVPHTPWAVHPPRPAGTAGATTLLYVAQNAFLVQLQAALAGRQIRLESVHPVFTLVETEPAFASPGAAALAVLHASHGTGVFWLAPSGDRHAAFFTGPTAGERLQQAVDTGLALFEGRPRPPLLVLNASLQPPDPALLPPGPVVPLSVGAFLAASSARPLPAVTNLLPAPAPWWPAALAHSAAALVLLTTLLLGQHYLAARQQARVNLAYQQAQLRTLTAEVAHLEANRARIERAELFLAEISGGACHKGRFLAALGRLRPPQLTLEAVTLNESSWNIRGVLHEGAGDEHGPYATFHQAFFKDAPWLPGPDSRSLRPAAPEFSLNGSFPAPAPP